MKTLIAFAANLLCLHVSALSAAPVTEQKQWTDEYPVTTTTPHVEIGNIWGSVRVRPGSSNAIVVSITESRSAPDQALYERSLETLKLDVRADALGVSILVGDRENRWHGENRCKNCRVDYQFDIQVPPGSALDVGTVMDGRIDIAGVNGVISASNVNGPISISSIQDCAAIKSVNGRVDVDFSVAPAHDCSIETINGDIRLNVPANSGMDVSLDLFNGKVSSELPVNPLILPATVEQIVADGRTQYRVQQLTGMRVGAGGPLYSIASMNGDLRISKQN